ncbi:unnamed protein product, partial [Nesidiocoris tenuis]
TEICKEIDNRQIRGDRSTRQRKNLRSTETQEIGAFRDVGADSGRITGRSQNHRAGKFEIARRRDVTHQSSGGSLISHPEFIFDDDGVVGLEVEIAYDAVEPVEIKPKEVKTKSVVTDKKCARTFLTFSNEEEFRKAFPIRKPPKVKPPQTCVFTG